MQFVRVKLKDHFQETRLFSGRVIVAGIGVLLLILIIVARMIFLQVASHEHYTTLSQNNRVSIVPVPPTRGLIFDRNGIVLAQNLPSFSLELIPEKIDDIEATIEALKNVVDLSDGDIAQFHKIKKRKSAFKSVSLKYRLNEQEVARFAVRQHQFPGVDIRARLMRHYPHGASAVHALGYVGRINEAELKILDAANYSGSTHVGKTGVERYYESVLHGTVGFQKIETNARGRVLRVLEERRPVAGKNIYLGLDIKLQKIAEKALGDRRGAVVAIIPQTGNVLVLVSTPGFDPNLFVNGIDVKSYRDLSTSANRPLFNRAIKGRYPPGSTLKPFTGLAGLEYGDIQPETKIFCKGWFQLKNDKHKYRDWKKTGHGHTTLERGISESCDVYYYSLSLKMGIDKMSRFNEHFGLGKKTGIDILGETAGINPSRAWKRKMKHQSWYPGETLITGIGQGFSVTSPLQLAVATATLANYGLHIRPHLAFALQESESDIMEYVEPVVVNLVPIKNKKNWDHMIKSMGKVVTSKRGSARNIRSEEYDIAGKTGTAQVYSIKQDEEYDKENLRERLRDHALFVAFAPLENPKIAISIIVENGESGGKVAAPIARKVMDAYLLKADEP